MMMKYRRRNTIALEGLPIHRVVICVVCLSIPATSLHMKSKRPSLFPANMRDVVANNRSPFGETYPKDVASDSETYLKRRLTRERAILSQKGNIFRDSQNPYDVYKLLNPGVGVGARKNFRSSESFGAQKETYTRNDIYIPKREEALKNALKEINYLSDRNFDNRSPPGAYKQDKGYRFRDPISEQEKLRVGSSNTQKKPPAAQTLNLNKYLNKVFGRTSYHQQESNAIDAYKSGKKNIEDNYFSRALKNEGRSFVNDRSKPIEHNHKYEQNKPKTTFSYSGKQAVSDIRTRAFDDGVTRPEEGNSLLSWDTIETAGLPVTPRNNNVWKPIGQNLRDHVESYRSKPVDTYKSMDGSFAENSMYDLPDVNKHSFDNKIGDAHHNLFDRVGITDVPLSSKTIDQNVQGINRNQYPQETRGFNSAQQTQGQGRVDRPRFNEGSSDYYVKTINSDPTDTAYPDGYPITTVQYDHSVVHHPMDNLDQHKLPIHEHTSNTLFEVQRDSAINNGEKYLEKPHMKLHRQDAKFRYIPGKQRGTPSNDPSISVEFVPGSGIDKMGSKTIDNEISYEKNVIRKEGKTDKGEGKPPSFSIKTINWNNEQQQHGSKSTSSMSTEQTTNNIKTISIPIQTYLSTISKPDNSKDTKAAGQHRKPPVVIPVSEKKILGSLSTTSVERSQFSNKSSSNGSRVVSKPKPVDDRYVVLSGKEGRTNSLLKKTLILDDNHHITKSLAPYIQIKMSAPPTTPASMSSAKTSSATKTLTSIAQTTIPPTIQSSTVTTKIPMNTTTQPVISSISQTNTIVTKTPVLIMNDAEMPSGDKDNEKMKASSNQTFELSEIPKTQGGKLPSTPAKLESTEKPHSASSDVYISRNVSFITTTQVPTQSTTTTEQQNVTVKSNDVGESISTNDTEHDNMKNQIISDKSRTDVPPNLIENIPVKEKEETKDGKGSEIRFSNESTVKEDTENKELVKNQAIQNETSQQINEGNGDSKTAKTEPETSTNVSLSIETNPVTSTTNMGIQYEDDSPGLGKGQNASVYVEEITANTWSNIDNRGKQDKSLESYNIPSVEWLSKIAEKNSRSHHQHFVMPSDSLPDKRKDYPDDVLKIKPTLPTPSLDSAATAIDKKPCNDSFNKEEMMTIAFGILQLLLQNMKLQQSLRVKQQVTPQQAPKRRFLLIPLPANQHDPLSNYLNTQVNSQPGRHSPGHFVDYYSDVGQVNKSVLYPKSTKHNDRKYSVHDNSIYPNIKQSKDSDAAGLRRSKALLSLLQNKSQSLQVRNHAKRIAPRLPQANPNYNKIRTI